MKVQVIFRTNGVDNSVIFQKLKRMKDELVKDYGEDFTVHSCHLPRKIVEEKGWSTEVCDMFDTIFGDHYKCEVTAETYDLAMSELNNYRKKVARMVDKIYVISNETLGGVAIEIEEFSKGKIRCL